MRTLKWFIERTIIIWGGIIFGLLSFWMSNDGELGNLALCMLLGLIGNEIVYALNVIMEGIGEILKVIIKKK